MRRLGVLAIALAAGCSQSSTETTLAAPRTLEPVGRPIQWNASDAERFGISARDFAAPAQADAASASVTWTTPAGWSDLPARTFREVNLRVGGDERAECYATLSGTRGDLFSNVNRWRGQMSLPALDEAAVAALPTLEWLGQPAVLVDINGTWTGMSGDQAAGDWRLVGLMLVDHERVRSLKMTGPGDVIARELANFRALVASFKQADEHADHDHSHDNAVENAPPSSAAPAQLDLPPASGAFAWTAPAGWTQGAAKMGREVTFNSGADGAVECYVTLLAGDGGGLLANVNRWCGQLGAARRSEADIAALAREKILGVDAAIVELERGETATAPAQQEHLIGALCLLTGRAVFVKMTGPRAQVQEQRAAFLEFCRSLRTAN